MARTPFEKTLLKLESTAITVSEIDADQEHHSILIKFNNGSVLQADYWRIIKDGAYFLSSFDHKQKYGLPEPIDAFKMAKAQLDQEVVSSVTFDNETGDLVFKTKNKLKLQVFNFTGYEAWQIRFPDGAQEFSNHARKYE